jgi:hypothetical protein
MNWHEYGVIGEHGFSYTSHMWDYWRLGPYLVLSEASQVHPVVYGSQFLQRIAFFRVDASHVTRETLQMTQSGCNVKVMFK